MPDLLQTAGHIGEVARTWNPDAGRERVERIVQARVARQHRLTGDDPIQLVAVVTEGALRQAIGGPEAMRAQLRHLLDRAALPTVELRVVAASAGAHPGLAGRSRSCASAMRRISCRS